MPLHVCLQRCTFCPFCDEHQMLNYVGLMIPKSYEGFEKSDNTMIIKCEKPASKIKKYINITRSLGLWCLWSLKADVAIDVAKDVA